MFIHYCLTNFTKLSVSHLYSRISINTLFTKCYQSEQIMLRGAIVQLAAVFELIHVYIDDNNKHTTF